MRLAIMQPYLFPYLGYFQLMSASDCWVAYDDVGYIKQGWINRNYILAGGQTQRFTVALHNASSFRAIRDTRIDLARFDTWKGKFYKTLSMNYRSAPHYRSTLGILASVLDRHYASIGALAVAGIVAVAKHLELSTRIVQSSSVYDNSHLKSVDRIIDICSREQAEAYVNPVSGQHLYSSEQFAQHRIRLSFLSPRFIPYRQFDHPFVPRLSIIDALMFNDRDELQTLLASYDLS